MFHNREKLVKTAKAPAEKSLSAREALEQKLPALFSGETFFL